MSAEPVSPLTAPLHIVLAAGEGTRMRSTRPKVMHEVAHRPLVGHVVAAVLAAADDAEIALVRGPDHDGVEQAVRAMVPKASCHIQRDRLGTAHAALAARARLDAATGPVIVLFGDTPLLLPDTLRKLHGAIADGAAIAVVGFEARDPSGYGRLIMDDAGLGAIREDREASDAERAITLCNGGMMAFDGRLLPGLLDRIGNDNAKSEYYLTDAVALARGDGGKVVVVTADEAELAGVNNRAQLAEAEHIVQERLRADVMSHGVTLIDPASVHLAMDTRLGQDSLVEPNVVFGPGVTVEAGATIRAFSHLEGCHVGPGAVIGPFARLRPGARLGRGARAGNFVEIKNAEIADGAKINHLSYVGDASVGTAANVGAGTITCNYDGDRKHRTEIGAGAFIGSNSALVAPITIGDGAYVGSGSTVTEDVPDGALAIGRGRQVTKEGRAPKPKPKS